ncbi:MAG: hypothetical protein P8127_14730 [Acidobacteriota bacterium]
MRRNRVALVLTSFCSLLPVLARPVITLPGGPRSDRENLRAGILQVHQADRIALHQELADGDHAVEKGDLHDLRRADLLDVFPVEGQLVQLIAVELELLFIHHEQLALEPFVRGELNPIELLRHRWIRFPVVLVVGSDQRGSSSYDHHHPQQDNHTDHRRRTLFSFHP